MGTSVGTKIYLQHGWRASGALALGFQGLQLVFLFLRGPNVGRYTWLGWKAAPKQTTEGPIAAAPAAPQVSQAPATPDPESQVGQEASTNEKA